MPDPIDYQNRAEGLAMFFKRCRSELYLDPARQITVGANVLAPMWIETQEVTKTPRSPLIVPMPMCISGHDYPDRNMLSVPPAYSDGKGGLKTGDVFSTAKDCYLGNYYYPKNIIPTLQKLEAQAYSWAGIDFINTLTMLYVDEFPADTEHPEQIAELHRLRFSGEMALYYAQYWLDKENHLLLEAKKSAINEITKSNKKRDKLKKAIEANRRIKIITQGDRGKVIESLQRLNQSLETTGAHLIDPSDHQLMQSLLNKLYKELNSASLVVDPQMSSDNICENVFIRRLYRLLNGMHKWKAKTSGATPPNENICTQLMRHTLQALGKDDSVINSLIDTVVKASDKLNEKLNNPDHILIKTIR